MLVHFATDYVFARRRLLAFSDDGLPRLFLTARRAKRPECDNANQGGELRTVLPMPQVMRFRRRYDRQNHNPRTVEWLAP
jgi:hypothetical protein